MKLKYHKKPQGYAKGGEVRDPVSGNDVPPGALPNEVRDDIDAKLSEGEFVVPADVVRYVGLDKLMAMRDEAKAGLAKMDAEGQIGGTTSVDDLDFLIDSLDAEDFEDRTRHFAEGGDVSRFVGAYKERTGREAEAPAFIQHKAYTNNAGDVKYIPFLRGQPIGEIPVGYYPMEQEAQAGAVSPIAAGEAPVQDQGVRTLTESEQAWDDILGSGRYSDANEIIQRHYMVKSDRLNRDRLTNMQGYIDTMDPETEDLEGYLMSAMTPEGLELYHNRFASPQGLDAVLLKDSTIGERMLMAQRTAGTLRRNEGMPDEALANPEVAKDFIGETPTMADIGAGLKTLFGESPTFKILSNIASSLFGHLTEDEALAKAAETPEGKAAVDAANAEAEVAAGITPEVKALATVDPTETTSAIATRFTEAQQALTDSTSALEQKKSEVDTLAANVATMKDQGLIDAGLIGALQDQLNTRETELSELEGTHSELQGNYQVLQSWLDDSATVFGMTRDELLSSNVSLTDLVAPTTPEDTPAATGLTGEMADMGVEIGTVEPPASFVDLTTQTEEEDLFAQPVEYTPTEVEREAEAAADVVSSGGGDAGVPFTSGGVFSEEDDDWINQMEQEFAQEDNNSGGNDWTPPAPGTGTPLSQIKSGTGQTIKSGTFTNTDAYEDDLGYGVG